jgi:D-lactate dehydrogenase
MDGSLKAEHGTGRNMAPFVEREGGSEIFGVMKEIKRIFDPEGLINPGVVLNDDPDIFIKNFKTMPAAVQLWTHVSIADSVKELACQTPYTICPAEDCNLAGNSRAYEERIRSFAFKRTDEVI